MNVFAFSDNQRESVDQLCDKHLTKMPLESVQILNTALHIHERDDLTFYGKSHQNHPVCKWAAENFENWLWLYDYAIEIGKRFETERGKEHKSISLLYKFNLDEVYHALPKGKRTAFPMAMPVKYHHADSCVAYQRYYYFDKSRKEWFDHTTCKSVDY